MKVYILTANTLSDEYDGWGCEITLFGVYDSLEKAEKAKKKLKYPLPKINEVELNKKADVYLGGYIEWLRGKYGKGGIEYKRIDRS